MSKLKLGAHMSIAGGVSQGLQRASSIGCNAVQVFTKNNRQWKGVPLDREDAVAWEKDMPNQGIEYAVSHASYLINLASPKPDGEEAGIARIAEGLNTIHSAVPECDDTMTLLEAMAGQGTTLGYRFHQLGQMIKQVDDPSRVGVCLDTCHIFAAGYDIRTKAGYEAMMSELDGELGLDKVKCWHFNDSKGALDSRKDRHTHIGEGTPKKADLKDDVRNLARLCSLVDDPERIPTGLNNVA